MVLTQKYIFRGNTKLEDALKKLNNVINKSSPFCMFKPAQTQIFLVPTLLPSILLKNSIIYCYDFHKKHTFYCYELDLSIALPPTHF